MEKKTSNKGYAINEESLFFNNGDYRYIGKRLTGKKMAEIICCTYTGKEFSSREAVDYIKKYHESRRGVVEAKDYMKMLKSARRIIRNNPYYRLEDSEQGHYRLSVVDDNSERQTLTLKDEGNGTQYSGNTATDKIKIRADCELGEGSGSVYAFYFPAYKELAELKGSNVFQCKIGMSDNDAYERVRSECGTGTPENPHVQLVIKCDKPLKLERCIQSVLELRGKKITDIAGDEWFYTNEDEIMSIYNFIMSEKVDSL